MSSTQAPSLVLGAFCTRQDLFDQKGRARCPSGFRPEIRPPDPDPSGACPGAIGPRLGAVWGRLGAVWGRLGAVFGPKDTVDSVPQGYPTRCPSIFRPRTQPPDPTGAHPGALRPRLGPFGAVWGRLGPFGGQIGQRTDPAGGNRAQRGAAGPLRWLLEVPGPIRGAAEPQWAVSVFDPVLGLVAAACLLPAC